MDVTTLLVMALGASSVPALLGAGTYLAAGLLLARPWQFLRAVQCGLAAAALHLLLLGLGWVVEGSLLGYVGMLVSSAALSALLLQADFSKRGAG